jgi:DNA-binding transcriptional ArsR family regulator
MQAPASQPEAAAAERQPAARASATAKRDAAPKPQPAARASATAKRDAAAAPKRDRIPHPDTGVLDLATIMRTLGDPVRLDIVRLLSDDAPRVCNDIAELMGLPNSTCSYHLRLLREAGVTRARAQGTQRLVTLRREDLETRFPGLVEVLTR